MSSSKKKYLEIRGAMLVQVIVFASVSILFLSGLIGWAGINVRVSRESFYREQALQIAEAGIDYYRWHLAHDQDDFQDGTGGPGPYVHDFFDRDGNRIGVFELEIVPPSVGSTIVTVRSRGIVDAYPSVSRRIETKLAIPSFAKYAWVLNSFVNFGSGAQVFGPVHSNQGVRFDGLANNIVSSSLTTFDDPSHDDFGVDPLEWAVHTHDAPLDPLPPTALPNRPDVFQAGRQISVPVVDFAGITLDLADIKASAQSPDGFYRAGSGAFGYRVLLRTNDTFDLYRVNSLRTGVIGGQTCTTTAGTWSISTAGGAETLLGNFSFPANGTIFLEDNTWVEGTIDTARVTIGVGRFPDNPTTRPSITVNNDIRYTNTDGTDVLGLIAQGSVNVGLYSEEDLRIDAALMAQNGRIGRFAYSSNNCGTHRFKDILTTYGMLGSNIQSAFNYGTSGFNTRVYNYDSNLLYGPPPSFPLTSDQYQTISWQEIK